MSLKRLRERKLPETRLTLRVDFSPEADTAIGDLVEANQALSLAKARGDDLARYQARADAAREVVDEGRTEVVVRALTPDEFERLRTEHPPKRDDKGELIDKDAGWDRDTFVPALLSACITDDEGNTFSPEEWAEMTTTGGQFAAGEVGSLFETVLMVNDRSPDMNLGKGLTRIRN